MNIGNLVNIHWYKQSTLKDMLDSELLYTQTDTKGLFVKIPFSNIMLNCMLKNHIDYLVLKMLFW